MLDHQRIVPMLSYRDAPAAITFLCRAFGFAERFRFDMDDGRVGHAELGRDGNIVMLASEWPESGLVSPRALTGMHGQIMCYVDDVDAHFAAARDAGATIAAEPATQPHGNRIYRAIDPEGHRWIFATQVAEASSAEMEQKMGGKVR